MEKINVFDYIEKACAVLDNNLVGFTHAAAKLTEYLNNTFGDSDATVGVTSRIKTRDSLKEKILRNNLYKEYPAERLVYEMHDIIGVRVECRFLKDERYLYNAIREVFKTDVGGGYYSPENKKAVKLKLDTLQPEKQKNGFEIYRIDGNVIYAGESYNFELQIKSLVNSFWSEIEHKLVYKNIRFNADSLMKDMLNSIYENLTSIDHQLNLIFERSTGNAVRDQQSQLKKMLVVALNEVYTAIVKSSTDITVSITEYSEAIVTYLLTASSYAQRASGESLTHMIRSAVGSDDEEDENSLNYSDLFFRLMEWMRSIDYHTICIGEKIDVTFDMPHGIQRDVAEIFLTNINEDFYLNTFFHIFFSLERGNDKQDFADYIRYYCNRILNGKTQEQIYRTLAALTEVPAHKLPLEQTLAQLEATANEN